MNDPTGNAAPPPREGAENAAERVPWGTISRAEAAQRAYGALHTHTIGFAALEASRARSAPVSGEAGGLAGQLAAYTTTGQFTAGLHYLLEGISSHAGEARQTGQPPPGAGSS